MLQDIGDGLESLLGLGESSLDLSADEMILRAIIIYIFTLLIIRFGQKRFLGQHTAFDIVMGIILGTVISRAVTGTAAFLPSLLAGLTLVVLHYLMSALAVRSHRMSKVIAGESRILVEHGEVRQDNMKTSHISDRDLQQAARENANMPDPERIDQAWLERSGIISIVPKSSPPQIVDIQVENGVQLVRLRID